MPEKQLVELARKLGERLSDAKWRLATAESCTGGGLAFYITSMSGSSEWFDRGFVTYSNQAKQDLLHVPRALIEEAGAVSEATAQAMAEGALKDSDAQIAVSITGIAGPEGGTPEKPVGMVCFSVATEEKVVVMTQHFSGDREAIRHQAMCFILDYLLKMLAA